MCPTGYRQDLVGVVGLPTGFAAPSRISPMNRTVSGSAVSASILNTDTATMKTPSGGVITPAPLARIASNTCASTCGRGPARHEQRGEPDPGPSRECLAVLI
jgi:hypothetical protein